MDDVQNRTIRIVGAGISCLDHILVTPPISWGEMAHASVYCTQGGGLAATALVAAARLGAKTSLYSVLGDDAMGDQLVEELASEGISMDGVMRVDGEVSPFSFIHVNEDTGERTIFHKRAAGLKWGERGLSAIAGADALLVDGSFPELARQAVAEARRHGVPSIADACPNAGNLDWLRDVDVLIAPKDYLREGDFGDDVDGALDAIHSVGPGTAIVTLGEEGWAASDATGRSRGPAFRVDVVDTVGAGDVFHGAYAYALARGWEMPRLAEFASAAAALKCTRVGGRTGIPDLERTLAFLRERVPDYWF